MSTAEMNALEEGTETKLEFSRLGKFGEKNLVVMPVAIQNADTLEFLYIAYVTEEAVRETLQTGRVVLWSTSRNKIWRKGETSGDYLNLVDVRVNCEQNSLLYLVRPVQTGACHTRDANGQTRTSCYYRSVKLEGDNLVLDFVAGKK
jgi:phosphoribosyl-AMP cyclohydrolase